MEVAYEDLPQTIAPSGLHTVPPPQEPVEDEESEQEQEEEEEEEEVEVGEGTGGWCSSRLMDCPWC